MNRHVLVGTDGSPNADDALRYAARFFRGVEDVDVTAATVAPPISPALLQGGFTFEAEKSRLSRLDEVRKRQEEECARILSRAGRILSEEGMEEARIHVQTILGAQSVLKALVHLARSGSFDAVLVGRRGLGQVVSFFMGSISSGLLGALGDVPVWIVDTPDEPRKVLIALDSCEECLCVVDHTAFMLAGVPDARITVLHVLPRFRPFFSSELSGSCADLESMLWERAEEPVRIFLEKAAGIFQDAGLDPSRIDLKVKRGGAGVAREILKEYGQGGYGTLVVGRRGVGGFEAVFPGSVSTKLISAVSRGAVWVVGHTKPPSA